jgi:hypothetical protein
MNRNIFVILILAVLFTGCKDLIDPAQENIRDLSTTYKEPNFGYNLLTNGYARIPTNNWSFNDVATDDAVSNDLSGNNYLKLATGQWAANNNPADQWTSCNTGIQYMNIVINEADKMSFSEDDQVDAMFKDRIKGEAYGLRALFMYHLLQAHAGWVNGKLLGFPISLTEQKVSTDFNVPRNDFNECVAQIYKDINTAISLLPQDYVDVPSNGIPAKYTTAGVTDYQKYNRVFGVKFLGLMSGCIVKTLRAQLALLAASPAFNRGSTNGSAGKWEDAAVYAAEIVNLKGGINGLPAFNYGVTWFNNSTEINALKNGANSQETIWRAATGNNRDIETDMYPPTLFGKGRINPTQNLVDAFPDKNGYPITSAGSVYSSANPYANRDPRLKAFILCHGSTLRSTTINMETTNDAVNKVATSTRTGYYMLKLLRQDVNVNPSGANTQLHYKPRMRYTEMYLAYAEAANEAWGPLADPKGYGFSAYDVIKAIRKRALGVTTDSYLESIKNDPVAMRQLIRNERRLELCFEGFRFWDLRRWKVDLATLNTPALGITVTGGVVGSPATVENRVYKDYMIYGPIPYGETVKWSNLLQNDGWK